jgi:hypothetical protein
MSEPGSVVARALAWLRQTWNQAPPTLRQRWPWFIAGGALLGFLVMMAVRWAAPSDGAGEQPVATDAEEGSAGSTGEGSEGPGSPVQPPLKPGASAADAGAPLSPNVKLRYGTFPPRRASVLWGKKRLGFTDRGKPLVF